MVVDHELKNVIRSHHDIETDNTPHMKKAIRVSYVYLFIYFVCEFRCFCSVIE